MKTIDLTDKERAALQMLHFACNGAATVTCPGSEVLGTLNNVITELMRGNVEHAALILNVLASSTPDDVTATYSVTSGTAEFTATLDRKARNVRVVWRETTEASGGVHPLAREPDFRGVGDAFAAHYGVRLEPLRGYGEWSEEPNGTFTQTMYFTR